jgi:hypothetical protein
MSAGGAAFGAGFAHFLLVFHLVDLAAAVLPWIVTHDGTSIEGRSANYDEIHDNC